MEDEYQSNLANKIKNLDNKNLNSEQSKINKLINLREKELSLDMKKHKEYLAKNKKYSLNILYFSITIFIIFLTFSFYALYENIRYSERSKNNVLVVLQNLNEKIKVLPTVEKDFVINQKIVSYKKSKYLKIRKTDLIKIGNNPNHKYLKMKNQ